MVNRTGKGKIGSVIMGIKETVYDPHITVKCVKLLSRNSRLDIGDTYQCRAMKEKNGKQYYEVKVGMQWETHLVDKFEQREV